MDSKIVKVLTVVDTREYMEDGDRWVAIPGSGQARDCDRCGRSHEVHATVALADGSTAVVGTGCANAETLEVQAALRTGAAQAKTARKAEYLQDKVDAAAWRVVAAALGAWSVDAERADRTATPEDYRRCCRAWNLIQQTRERLQAALWYRRATDRLAHLEQVAAKVETTIAAAWYL